MIKHLAAWTLKINGWKAIQYPPPDLKKFVLIIAPHTSMWDFVWGKLILISLGFKVKFLIKKEVFWFPLGLLLKALGGLPVDRTKGSSVIEQVVEAFEQHHELIVAITPEGTRARTTKWKMGYHKIARSAAVPVGVGYLDYSNLTYGIAFTYHPSKHPDKDFLPIAAVYQNKTGKHPEKFSLPNRVSTRGQ